MIANNNSNFLAPTGSKKQFTKETIPTDSNFMKYTQSRLTFIENLKRDYSPENNQNLKEKEKMMV